MNKLDLYLGHARLNSGKGVDLLMENLHMNISLRETKMIDFFLGQMDSDCAINRVVHYLFNGSQMQRNYAVLFLARKNIWKPINRAYKMKLVDYKQAYSR